MKKCQHENIVKLIDVKKSEKNLYLFLEYCAEGTLEDVISRGNLSEDIAVSYFIQIMKGLQVLNSAGIVHRDLKPANLLIMNQTVKIGDFGLAKKCLAGDMLTSYKGTPLYMAP